MYWAAENYFCQLSPKLIKDLYLRIFVESHTTWHWFQPVSYSPLPISLWKWNWKLKKRCTSTVLTASYGGLTTYNWNIMGLFFSCEKSSVGRATNQKSSKLLCTIKKFCQCSLTVWIVKHNRINSSTTPYLFNYPPFCHLGKFLKLSRPTSALTLLLISRHYPIWCGQWSFLVSMTKNLMIKTCFWI